MSSIIHKTAPTCKTAVKTTCVIVSWILIWFGFYHPNLASKDIQPPQEKNQDSVPDLILAELNPSEILLGEPTTLSVRVRAGMSGTWRLPNELDLSPFTELARSNDTEIVRGEKAELIQLRLTTFKELGDLTIPSFKLEMESPSGTQQKFILVPPSSVRVLSVLEGIPEPQPRDITGPMEVVVPDYRLFVFLGLCMVWLLMGLLLRNKFHLPNTTRVRMRSEFIDARELALKKLRQIIQDDPLHGKSLQEYFIRISEAIREYIGKRFGFFALDLTTRELVQELKARHVPEMERKSVQKILEEADLVKFARLRPTEEMSSKMFKVAFQLVEQTNWSSPKMEDA